MDNISFESSSVDKTHQSRRFRRRILIVSIMLPIALLHFFTGKHYSGPLPDFVNGYLIDILLPFGVYFLFSNISLPIIKRWWVKASLVFAIGATVETLQYLGIPIFGQTFDPLDYIMYASGAILGAICDTMVFPRIFRFWAEPSSGHESN